MPIAQHPIYLITGDMTLVEERVQEITRVFLGDAHDEHSFTRLYADSDVDPVAEANGFSMFSPVMICYKNAFCLAKNNLW